MASLSRVRSRLSSISRALDYNQVASPYIYLEHLEVGAYSILKPNLNHNAANFYTVRRELFQKAEQFCSKSSTNTGLQSWRLGLVKEATISEAGTSSTGVQKLFQRLIQSVSQNSWDHPWSRDKLAERMAVLKQRRIDTQRLKKRNTRRLAAIHYSPSFSVKLLPSQPLKGALEPKTPEEARVAYLLARSDLIVTRNIEWANVLVGFEQENKYVVMDPREGLHVVGYIAESSNWLTRQLLRSRRPFEAAVVDSTGIVLFKVKRPIWFINSTIYAEVDGKVVGFAKRRWHLWRRIYDVYLGQRQFAVVENPGFWNWTFTLKDENGRVLAEIDRHFRGFGYEMLTDAGQYAIRFGDVASNYHPPTKPHTLSAGFPNSSQLQGIHANPEFEDEQFKPERPLNLMERTVTVALAISLDNDYFSRSRGFFMFPMFSDES